MNYTTIGNNIRKQRGKSKLTQSTLASMLGTDKAAISRMEHGKRITLENLSTLSEALNCSLVELLDGDFFVTLCGAYQSAPDNIKKAICDLLEIDYE